jgi:hypothetical protein
MHRCKIAIMLVICMHALSCGSMPDKHRILIKFPEKECAAGTVCNPFKGCYSLIDNNGNPPSLTIEVGPTPLIGTEIGCLWETASLTGDVYYQAGREPYDIKVTYVSNGRTVMVNDGPYYELMTPWEITLQ